MAIRITERKPLIKPDWYNEKEREMNLKNQVITNEDSSQEIQVVDKVVQVIENKEISDGKEISAVELVNDKEDNIPQEDDFEEVDNKLKISKQLGQMIFDGDKLSLIHI